MFVVPSNPVSIRHGRRARRMGTECATSAEGERWGSESGPRPRWESRAAVRALGDGSGGAGGSGNRGNGGNKRGEHPVRPIGDGSTSFTGKQPKQPGRPRPLEPGETPPQFVVFSWDGAGEVGNGLFPRFLKLAEEHDASMTFFLSGLYLLPESKKRKYPPPNNAPRRVRHRLSHRRPHQVDAEERPAGLARRPRDRHALQRPLLRRQRHGRQLDARPVEERDRPGEVLRQGMAHEHGLERGRGARAALRL